MNKILAIIPARYASSRFPAKPLALIRGKSMIERTYLKVHASKKFFDVIVATDDERIMQHCYEKNIKAMMTSSMHQSGTERCAEVLEKQSKDFDFVVNIQGDEPFVAPESIAQLVDLLISTDCDIATLCKKTFDQEIIDSPNKVKVVKTIHNKALYFSRSIIPFQRDNQISDKEYFIHLGMYAFKSKVLKEIVKLPLSELEKSEQLEQLRWVENSYSIAIEETRYDSIGVDTPEDILLIEKQLENGRIKEE